jgi:hypothetical protein
VIEPLAAPLVLEIRLQAVAAAVVTELADYVAFAEARSL